MCEQKGLSAGFAKIDVTPDYPTGLRGYSNEETRQHEAVAERIYVTCIAVTDGEETILLYTLDNCACEHHFAERIRSAVTPLTDIPGEKIFCSATHAHSAPSTGGYPNALRYRGDLVVACVRAAREALADRAPAKLLAAKQAFPGMNFVRHYITANGAFADITTAAAEDNPVVGYAAEPDRQMVLIKFQREGVKKSILLVNWQGHPDCSSQIGFLNIAPSYPGPLRDTLGAYTGDLVAYFTGADGNTVIESRLEADKHGLNWREYGVKMAELGYGLYKQLTEVEGHGIATARRIVEVQIDHSWDHRIDEANEVFDLWKSVGKTEGNELAKKYGFTSVYQARAIRSRRQMSNTSELEINAFRIGGVGFTTGTYEMFSESGMSIKENSPFEYTFLLTGNFTYIPSANAFNYRCYEADTGFFARGTAEMLVDNYLEMLNGLR